MASNISKYVNLDIVQTIQELYAERLDLSTNIFDGEGQINLVNPSNITAICAECVRYRSEIILARRQLARRVVARCWMPWDGPSAWCATPNRACAVVLFALRSRDAAPFLPP